MRGRGSLGEDVRREVAVGGSLYMFDVVKTPRRLVESKGKGSRDSLPIGEARPLLGSAGMAAGREHHGGGGSLRLGEIQNGAKTRN